MTISFFVKKAAIKELQVTIQPRSLSVESLDAQTAGALYQWEFELAHEIDVARSEWKQYSTKIEVVLRKKEEGIQWTDLESDEIQGSIPFQVLSSQSLTH